MASDEGEALDPDDSSGTPAPDGAADGDACDFHLPCPVVRVPSERCAIVGVAHAMNSLDRASITHTFAAETDRHTFRSKLYRKLVVDGYWMLEPWSDLSHLAASCGWTSTSTWRNPTGWCSHVSEFRTPTGGVETCQVIVRDLGVRADLLYMPRPAQRGRSIDAGARPTRSTSLVNPQRSLRALAPS